MLKFDGYRQLVVLSIAEEGINVGIGVEVVVPAKHGTEGQLNDSIMPPAVAITLFSFFGQGCTSPFKLPSHVLSGKERCTHLKLVGVPKPEAKGIAWCFNFKSALCWQHAYFEHKHSKPVACTSYQSTPTSGGLSVFCRH